MSTLFEQLARLSPERRALLERRLVDEGLACALPDRIPRRPAGSRAPLSFAQQRLWFMQQLDPAATTYNVASVLRLTGRLDAGAMQRSLAALAARHESLRTRFVAVAGGAAEQVVEPQQAEVLALEDATAAPDPEAHARARIRALIHAPFDLARVPLRSVLLKVADQDHLLVLVTHHIVSDRWSVGVFLRELAALYHAEIRGQAAALPPLPVQYADWAAWQQRELAGDELMRLSAYWTHALRGDLAMLDLPYDRPRSALARDAGAWLPIRLSADLSQRLRSLAKERKTTLFALLLGACKALLHRYTESTDILIGTDLANRERPETEHMIGLLVNTLVLRSDLSGDPRFGELLDRVRGTLLDALAHQALPFEKLVELVNPARDLDRLSPLFQVKFDLQLAAVQPIALDGLRVQRETPADEHVKYELRFNLQDEANGIDGIGGIGGQIEYSSDLFDAATTARMAGHFQALLEGIVARPDARLSELPLVSADERRRLLFDCNRTGRAYAPVASLVALFERQVAATPDAVAVGDGHAGLTYRELDLRASRLAAALASAGVSAQTPVGICMPRTPRLIVGLLGILKAGGCYIPLDPEYPAERLRFIAQDAAMRIVVVDGLAPTTLPLGTSLAKIALDDTPGDASARAAGAAAAIQADHLAYVIYTSGSTGRPKGVAIEHRNAVAMVQWALEEFSPKHLNGVLAATSICFDLSVFEIFVPLACGGRVVVVDNLLGLPRLPHGRADCSISLVNTVPSVLTQLLNTTGLPASVKVVNLAGEALPPALLQRLRGLGSVERVYNLYGPSEDTTYSTWARFDMAAPLPPMTRVPIGAPITNTQAYVLDAAREPLPIGVAGELYLGGNGLARGYLERAELTAASFIANPFHAEGAPSSRLYRTGDRVRRRPDGALEFLGRRDDQVKIRGHRIETGEVDYVLRKHPAVRDAIVTTCVIDDGLQLVAYVECDEDGFDAAALREFLRLRLPGYLVPTRLLRLDALPRLPNGKIDRHALPAVDAQTQQTPFEAPRNDLEQRLAEVWGQMLKRAPIGIHDDFFQAGGHSLLAIEIASRCEPLLGRRLPLRALFQHPTIARLAVWLADAKTAGSAEDDAPHAPLAVDAQSRHEPFPLTDIQQAYLLGRHAGFELGNIGTHGYREIEVSGIAVDAVEHALNQLIARHDMLRALITEDGRQRILTEVARYSIALHRLDESDGPARETYLAAVRERLSHQVFEPHRWPLFQVEASALGGGRIRFHLSFDVLIGDAWSFQLLGRELVQLLRGAVLPPLGVSFRDYVLHERAGQQTEAYRRSLDYWRARLATLPAAPELPLATAPSRIDKPRFLRRSGRLPAAEWQSLQARGRQHGLTPSAVLLAVFAESLARYCRRGSFSLNLTLFNRRPLHPDVNRLVGDFTSSLLLAVEQSGDRSLAANARRVQARLWEDLEHRAVSGVQVQRELARRRERAGGALMPVVFTSTLNQAAQPSAPQAWNAEIVHAVSQTSQVYLDHQVSEVDGELRYNWDAVEALLPPGLLDGLCARHAARLHELAQGGTSGERAWERRASEAASEPWLRTYNATRAKLHGDDAPLLHELFFVAARTHGDRPAILSPERTLSYGQLAHEARALARRLRAHAVQPNELVAVSAAKGWRQAVATLGILAAGGAYVPIDPALPRVRRWELLEDTQARLLLTADGCALDWPDQVERMPVAALESAPAQSADDGGDPSPAPVRATDLAYVIYTSGSTGMPKGVMIDHRGAVNTVLDINRRHGVGPEDRVFGLSSLSFDLSVYDLFGTLAAGAALVLPSADAAQQPSHWLTLLREHRVTIWNSVPALMQLLLGEPQQPGDGQALRLAMLSGDWIPLALPEAIRARFPHARVVGMGGATEASIWSIDYPVEALDPAWRSIPYGRPLANQQWYVLDEALQPRPPWVPGQLCIGGVGVARGYWRRPALTAERFVPNPFAPIEAGLDDTADLESRRCTSVLYRTGDMGLYRPDGSIEFLGREDHQIKIAGHRIELGEIEAVLQQHPAVAAAAVAAHGSPASLSAYVVPAAADQAAPAAGLEHPLARLDFKQAHHNWQPLENFAHGIVLPGVPASPALVRRQSHRRFTGATVELERLSNWLATLRATPVEGAPFPKYRYPSAGSLYPLQTFLEVRPARVAGLAAGWYYYHPGEHHLLRVEAPVSSPAAYGPNRGLAEASAFGLFLVLKRSAIVPLYGEQARDLALIEAGYAGQALMEAAPELALGLCPVGGASLHGPGAALGLDDDYEVLHGLLGGPIEAAWNDAWQIRGEGGHAHPAEALLAWLRDRLPLYMVPQRVQFLPALPLTANGKLDRKALPTPAAERHEHVPPATPTEAKVAELWQSLLGLERVGMHDDFFAVGGNSLIAMQLMAKLRAAFQMELTLGQLFGALTPAAQAQLIDGLAAGPARAAHAVQGPGPILPVARTAPAAAVDVAALSDAGVDALLARLVADGDPGRTP